MILHLVLFEDLQNLMRPSLGRQQESRRRPVGGLVGVEVGKGLEQYPDVSVEAELGRCLEGVEVARWGRHDVRGHARHRPELRRELLGVVSARRLGCFQKVSQPGNIWVILNSFFSTFSKNDYFTGNRNN